MKRFLQFLASSRTLALLWAFIGLWTIAIGNISRFTYGCAWLVLMLVLIERGIDDRTP